MTGFCVLMILGQGLLCREPQIERPIGEYCQIQRDKLALAPRDFTEASPAVKRWFADQIETFRALCGPSDWPAGNPQGIN